MRVTHRLWRIRGVKDNEVREFLERLENHDLLAGNTKVRKQRLDESVKLVAVRNADECCFVSFHSLFICLFASLA